MRHYTRTFQLQSQRSLCMGTLSRSSGFVLMRCSIPELFCGCKWGLCQEETKLGVIVHSQPFESGHDCHNTNASPCRAKLRQTNPVTDCLVRLYVWLFQIYVNMMKQNVLLLGSVVTHLCCMLGNSTLFRTSCAKSQLVLPLQRNGQHTIASKFLSCPQTKEWEAQWPNGQCKMFGWASVSFLNVVHS